MVDPDEPTYLARADKIFSVNEDEDIAISENMETQVEVAYSDYNHTAAENIAVAAGVDVAAGAFSLAANMTLDKDKNSSVRTVRLDAYTKVIRYEVTAVGGLRLFPEMYTSEFFKKAVEVLPVDQIERKIGVFYATSLDLGAEIRKSYIMEAKKSDSKLNVQAELETKYNGTLFGLDANVGVTKRGSDSSAKMKVGWTVKGGDSMFWLDREFTKDSSSVQDLQKQWSATVNDSNLYPFNFQLGLMWDIIKGINPTKGEEFEKYLRAKWAANKKRFNPTKFLDGE